MEVQKKKVRAAFWAEFEPVIAEKVKGSGVQKCWLECIKEGGACGQLLSIHNPHRSAQDHFKPSACKAAKQAQGQEMLAEKRDISQVEARP